MAPPDSETKVAAPPERGIGSISVGRGMVVGKIVNLETSPVFLLAVHTKCKPQYTER